jgi:hypothetical protein
LKECKSVPVGTTVRRGHWLLQQINNTESIHKKLNSYVLLYRSCDTLRSSFFTEFLCCCILTSQKRIEAKHKKHSMQLERGARACLTMTANPVSLYKN